MARLVFVALLLASPLNGLWLLCPPAPASDEAAADECARICALHHSDKACDAVAAGDAIVWPVLSVGVAALTSAAMVPRRPMLSQPIADLVVDVRDRPSLPATPPPKA